MTVIPGPRVLKFGADGEVLRVRVAVGYFRIGPYAFLGRELNDAARALDAAGGNPLQIARGLVLLLVSNRQAVGHLIVNNPEDAQARARKWLSGRGSGAEVFLGEAVGSMHGRILYRFRSQFSLLRVEKAVNDARDLAYSVRKGDSPQDPAEFDRLVDEVAHRLQVIAETPETAALRAIAHELGRQKSPEAVERVLNRAISRLEQVAPEIIGPQETVLRRNGKQIQIDTRQGVRERYRLDVASTFSLADERIGAHLVGSHGNFVRDEYGNRSAALSVSAKKIINAGQERGLGVGEIKDDLVAALGTKNLLRSQSYWRVTASAFVNRSRTYSAFNTYRDASVTLYRVSAVLDEVTTEVCRFMDGRILDLDRALANFEEQEALEDPLQIKSVNPWLRIIAPGEGPNLIAARPPGDKGEKLTIPFATITRSGTGTKAPGEYGNALSDSEIMDKGVHGPPYHGNCRTDVVPELQTRRAPAPRAQRQDTVQTGETPDAAVARRSSEVDSWNGAAFHVDETDLDGNEVHFRREEFVPEGGNRAESVYMGRFRLTPWRRQKMYTTAVEKFGAKLEPQGFEFNRAVNSNKVGAVPVKQMGLLNTLGESWDAFKWKMGDVDFTQVFDKRTEVLDGVVEARIKAKTAVEAFKKFKDATGAWGIRSPGSWATPRSIVGRKKLSLLRQHFPAEERKFFSEVGQVRVGGEVGAIEKIWERKATPDMKGVLDDLQIEETLPGHISYFSGKQAKEFSDLGGVLYHETMPDIEKFPTMLSSKLGGLRATKSRWLAGIPGATSGGRDIAGGGADGAFVRFGKAGAHMTPLAEGGLRIYMKPRIFGRTDWRGSNEDLFGSVEAHNLDRRKSVPEVVKLVKEEKYQVDNELVFVDGIGTKDWDVIAIPLEKSRAEMLKALRDKGISEINGVPVEKFIIDRAGEAAYHERRKKGET